MTTAIIIISLSIAVIYSVMILIFAVSFFFRKDDEHSVQSDTGFVSVIIALRNESRNVQNLLSGLLSQDYAYGFEIILVDDHSDDNSCAIIEEFADERIRLFNLPLGLDGKKQALRFGVLQAKGEILLFTDADCSLSTNWISLMTSQLIAKDLQMLCGPVEFENSDSLFNEMFLLEFASLTGSGAAGFFINKPFMCNGANYAVSKTVFDEASRHFNDKYSSGDDVFLLHYISNKHKVGFIKNYDATVKTKAPESLKSFFNQRIRWASKTSGYRNPFAIFTAAVTFLMSALILGLLVFSVFNMDYFRFLIFTLFAKTIVDFIFLVPVTRFYKKTYLLTWLPLLQIFYPIYISVTALMSMFYKPYWKGRRIR